MALISAFSSIARADDVPSTETRKLLTVPYVGKHHAQAATVLYFNRCVGGCSVVSSDSNDVRTRNSTVPTGAVGTAYTIAPFAHGDAVWNTMMQCLKEVYSPYNVLITDVQPGPGVAYNENIVAGTAADVGLPSGVGGISPSDCSPLSYVISYSFANSTTFDFTDPMVLCYVAAQETGHTYGIPNHAWSFLSDGRSACTDPMSYRQNCLANGQRFFRNDTADCGDFNRNAPACQCGSSINSHQSLLSALGPGQSIIPAPTAVITAPAAGATIANGAKVTATAASKRGVAKVELWLNGFKWAEAKGAAFSQTGQLTTPYEITIPAEVPNSVLDVVVKASDDLGLETTSATVTVTKGAPCADASTCAAGQKCDAGKCYWEPAVGELGDACTYPQFCTSGLCIGVSGDEEMRCTETCIPGATGSCDPGYTCIAAGPTSGVCWPEESDGGGCCDAGNGAAAQSSLLALGLVFLLRRRSRRARA